MKRRAISTRARSSAAVTGVRTQSCAPACSPARDFIAVGAAGEEDHVGRVHDVEVADEPAQLGTLDARQVPVHERDARHLLGQQGLERVGAVGGLGDVEAERPRALSPGRDGTPPLRAR